MVRRFLATLAASVGLGSTLGAAAPRSVSPEAAPPAWIAYAGIVNQAITAQLGGDDPVAVRLHAYLDQIPGASAHAGVRLPIRVWVDAMGVITKVDFTPFAQQQPNVDLHALLTGLHLPKAPPRNMLLPIRLTINLDPVAASPMSGKVMAFSPTRAVES
jgi:hypothetical protein